MATSDGATLLSILEPWPIAASLAAQSNAADLINVSRVDSRTRAALHSFGPPVHLPGERVRQSLSIGSHQTSYWRQLKLCAPFTCSSPTHTRDSHPHPCRICTMPICEACVVRDSFAKGSENTYKNRQRFLCKTCWTTNKPHKRHKFIDQRNSKGRSEEEHLSGCLPETNEFCSCTNQKDGWLCISCKDAQNIEASTDACMTCFGEGCEQPLDDAKGRRRICLWCDKPISRGRASMASRLMADQNRLEAQARLKSNVDKDQSSHYKLQKLSRRDLRGDDAVKDDPEADVAQFVGHLDTVNYRWYIHHDGPSGEQVYKSKHGSWVYDQAFLLAIGRWCGQLPVPADLRGATTFMANLPSRTNWEKSFIARNSWVDQPAADCDKHRRRVRTCLGRHPSGLSSDRTHDERVLCSSNQRSSSTWARPGLGDVGRLPDHLLRRDIQAEEQMDEATEEEVSAAGNISLSSGNVAAGIFADDTEFFFVRSLQEEFDSELAKRLQAKDAAETESELVPVASCDKHMDISHTVTIP